MGALGGSRACRVDCIVAGSLGVVKVFPLACLELQ